MKSLGDPMRLRIVDLLCSRAMCVSDLAEHLDAELANVSHHLGVLRNAGLIERQRQGKYLIYQVRDGVYQQGYLDFGCCRLELPDSER